MATKERTELSAAASGSLRAFAAIIVLYPMDSSVGLALLIMPTWAAIFDWDGVIIDSSRQCVVFEDAHVGIQAAVAGGMKVVGVATTHPAESLQGADRVVRRLDELSVGEIKSWFA